MLEKSDYEEPACLLNMTPSGTETMPGGKKIPLPEIIRQADFLAGSNQRHQLRRHLELWQQRAVECGDVSGRISLLNELIGFYRMAGLRDEALQAVEQVLPLLRRFVSDEVTCGTILLNVATALCAFDEVDRAIGFYSEVFRLYGRHLPPEDLRFSGVFNNMAGAYLAKGDLPRAKVYYAQALKILEAAERWPDAATCYVNLAQAAGKADAESPEVEKNLFQALAILNRPDVPHDGYYAHTCRKCSGAFGFFGFFREDMELRRRATEIEEHLAAQGVGK